MSGAEKSDNGTTVVIGGPLIELAKALHELVEAFRDITGLIGDGANIVRRRRAGSAANHLDGLSFRDGGFVAPLTRIAAGEGSLADADQMYNLLRLSADGVERSVQALAKYKDTVRSDLGKEAADDFMGIVHDNGGKFVIRWEIEGLVWMVRDQKPRDQQQAQAESILKMIEALNQKLVKLHDRIYPPRGAPV